MFLAFVGPHGANCFDQAQIEAIDKLIIEQFQPANSIPGVGLAVVHGNSTLARGYGYRDLEQGLQVTSGTFFIIGSVSKVHQTFKVNCNANTTLTQRRLFCRVLPPW